MSGDKEAVQEAINRALKAANRALKVKAFDKVAEIYYRIAYMLNDMDEEEAAHKFSEAAKQFKEKNNIMIEINGNLALADEAYKQKDYRAVAENYLKISSLAELLGDIQTSKKFMVEADKFLEMATMQVESKVSEMLNMSDIASNIQSKVPTEVTIRTHKPAIKTKSTLGYDEAMVALGLICGHCGADINPDMKTCPKCGKPI